MSKFGAEKNLTRFSQQLADYSHLRMRCTERIAQKCGDSWIPSMVCGYHQIGLTGWVVSLLSQICISLSHNHPRTKQKKIPKNPFSFSSFTVMDLSGAILAQTP
jgi:hypothetical protein